MSIKYFSHLRARLEKCWDSISIWFNFSPLGAVSWLKTSSLKGVLNTSPLAAGCFIAEMQLQSNGIFVLTKISEQPVLQIGLDEPFVLEIDKTAWLKDTSSRLKLTAVTEDSRCPIEAICIREGTVRIVLSLYDGIDHAHVHPMLFVSVILLLLYDSVISTRSTFRR